MDARKTSPASSPLPSVDFSTLDFDGDATIVVGLRDHFLTRGSRNRLGADSNHIRAVRSSIRGREREREPTTKKQHIFLSSSFHFFTSECSASREWCCMQYCFRTWCFWTSVARPCFELRPTRGVCLVYSTMRWIWKWYCFDVDYDTTSIVVRSSSIEWFNIAYGLSVSMLHVVDFLLIVDGVYKNTTLIWWIWF